MTSQAVMQLPIIYSIKSTLDSVVFVRLHGRKVVGSTVILEVQEACKYYCMAGKW